MLATTTWDETAEKFRHVTDSLGKPIDEGIFDTVVVLNLLGIVTRQSCEGHLEWGVPYPWIDIVETEHAHQLHHYLIQFYQERHVNFDVILRFQGKYRLCSHGADFCSLLPGTEQKLEAYRAEMAAFTAFLKAFLKTLL